jgi:hypothetical protein
MLWIFDFKKVFKNIASWKKKKFLRFYSTWGDFRKEWIKIWVLVGSAKKPAIQNNHYSHLFQLVS